MVCLAVNVEETSNSKQIKHFSSLIWLPFNVLEIESSSASRACHINEGALHISPAVQTN